MNKYPLYHNVVLNLTLNHSILAIQVQQNRPVIWVEEEVNQASDDMHRPTTQPNQIHQYNPTRRLGIPRLRDMPLIYILAMLILFILSIVI